MKSKNPLSEKTIREFQERISSIKRSLQERVSFSRTSGGERNFHDKN